MNSVADTQKINPTALIFMGSASPSESKDQNLEPLDARRKIEDKAEELGRKLAENNYNFIVGGVQSGLHSKFAKGIFASGKNPDITEIILDKYTKYEPKDSRVNLRKTPKSIQEQINQMESSLVDKNGAGKQPLIAIPGSLGTIVEIVQFAIKAFSEDSNKVLAIFDINKIFKPLLDLFGRIKKSGLDHSFYKIGDKTILYRSDEDVDSFVADLNKAVAS